MSVRERSAFDTLDDAFHLLRELPVNAWVFYFLGTVPFLLVLLWTVAETNILYTPERGLENSFLCAGAFVWMQFWRVRFAGKLEEQLRPGNGEPWTATRVVRCVCIQAAFQSAKLFVLPLAALATLPYAWTACFFQNLQVLASRPSTSLSELVRNSAKLANPDQRQLWILISLMAAIGLFVFLNLAILAILFPLLIKMFLGIENEFTRGTGNPFTLQLFEITCGGTWLFMGPFTQAVFVQRVYMTEAVVSGADLLAALRRIAAAAVLIVCVAGMAQADVPAPELKKNIEQVLRERQYSWQANEKETAPDQETGFFNGLVRSIRSGLRAIGTALTWLGEWLRQLFDQDQSDSPPGKAKPPSQALRWMIFGLIGGIAIGLVLFFLRSPKPPVAAPEVAMVSVNLEDESVHAADLPEEGWLAMARECAGRQDYRLALRAVYLATLAHLGQRNLLALGNAKTNRDYVRELRRRAANDQLHSLFRNSVLTFEAAWYGRHETGERGFLEFERNFETLRRFAD